MRNLVLLFFVCSFISCAPARFVKPLAAKQQAVNLSVGGPLIEYSSLVIPMPLVSATYGYGIDSSLTAFGAVNLTSAFYGNVQLEIGATKSLLNQQGASPGISITPVANLIYRDKDAFKLYPQLDLNAYWDFNRNRNYFYVGVSNWFELSGQKAHKEAQTRHWLISPMLGQAFVRKKWDFILEIKIIAPNIESDKATVDYVTPLGKHGALGIYFGYTRKF